MRSALGWSARTRTAVLHRTTRTGRKSGGRRHTVCIASRARWPRPSRCRNARSGPLRGSRARSAHGRPSPCARPCPAVFRCDRLAVWRSGRLPASAASHARGLHPDSRAADTFDQTHEWAPQQGYTRTHRMPSRLHRHRFPNAGRAVLFSASSASLRRPAFSSRTQAQAKRPMTLVDLLNIPRVGDPQLSSDGRRLTFALQTTDWPGNRRVLQIWESRADGSGLRRLTSGATARSTRAGRRTDRPSPTCRGGNIFLMAADGGSQHQLSRHATGVSDIAWHPDGAFDLFPCHRSAQLKRSARGSGCAATSMSWMSSGRDISGRSRWPTGRRRGSRPANSRSTPSR